MRKKLVMIGVVIAMLSMTAVAAASLGAVKTKGAGPGNAVVNCPGGMARLGHPFSEDMTVFNGDPAIHITDEYTVSQDFFQVEDIDTGAHAGTHLDAPSHFIEGARSVDVLSAEEFVWPVYKMDVRGMEFQVGKILRDENGEPILDDDGNEQSLQGQIRKRDIRDYEREHGRIPKTGALVVLQTGAEEFWGAEQVISDGNDNAANVDDFFDFENAGFSADAIQWLFDKRNIHGVGSDAYGPDAALDGSFGATFTTLANDGVALVAIANLDLVQTRGDVIFASVVALEGGSGFSTDPIACLGEPQYGYNDDGWIEDDDDDDDDDDD